MIFSSFHFPNNHSIFQISVMEIQAISWLSEGEVEERENMAVTLYCSISLSRSLNFSITL
jgi:hypothetical protein